MFGGKGNRGKDLKAKADKAFSEQKWKKALELYQEATSHLGDDPRMDQRMGDLCRRFKMNDEAVNHYKRVAETYSHGGFWAKAIAINKIILEIDPTDTSVQRRLAEIYSKQGTQTRTIPDSLARAEPKERAAISIAGTEPLTLDTPPDDLGTTIDLASASGPGSEKVIDLEEPVTGNSLGTPVDRLSGVPLLSEMSTDELFSLMERLTVRRFPPDSFVCEEGDIGASMYIISEGQVEVFARDGDGSRLVLCRLRGGDFFGEFGLLTNGRRNATVEAKTEVELLELTRADLDAIAVKHPRIWNVLEDYIRRRVIDTILRKSDVFRALTERERMLATEALTLRKVKMGETVMAEGSEGDEMFFVKSGKLLVLIGEGNHRVVVGELGPGEYFGEVAMLTGKPRMATIQAKQDSELYALRRQDAAGIFKNNSEILLRLKKKMTARREETAEVQRSMEEARKTLEMV